MTESTQAENLLLRGLKIYKIPREEAAAIVVYLNEENQWLMIDYLATHPMAEYQEIMNEFGRLLKKQKY